MYSPSNHLDVSDCYFVIVLRQRGELKLRVLTIKILIY